ncbi:MAG: 3-hydroxybutyryl-CoA dehydrogenase [Saprospiraceae bacterium]|nr:MAG: 3-hydroxybutyryl-CoA dehydrogenase [Bacteroidetes bacterium OLB9]MCO6463764.1 3-hydroxybutyryl-CoA dehydrogenase [Saprospiraceae bacterium]MCZ2338148.1 3-hydroxybutyryl-CoA dehydrogenase [Chitinophagales bacterium]
MKLAVIGAGAMGSGIGQVAAMAGWEVYLYDSNVATRAKVLMDISISLGRFAAKGKISQEDSASMLGRIYICESMQTIADADMVIEAIIEDAAIKKSVFQQIEAIVSDRCIIATNTSSLSVTSLASALEFPDRFIGVHFFNPPVLMQLVEVVPAVQTDKDLPLRVVKITESWGKTPVLARDTPGFIVNKVARPFYSEAIRILEEGIANIETIDHAMTQNGFRMGPFTLMDFIGHDVNYRVTESVWKSFFYDSRYRPSFTQLRLMEAGFLGKKSGRGFYNYQQPENNSDNIDKSKIEMIFMRIISMLINEAADTVYQNICTAEDVSNAMRLGVNYPKGLLEWGQELGYDNVVGYLDSLHQLYGEERYRVSPFLRRLAQK